MVTANAGIMLANVISSRKDGSKAALYLKISEYHARCVILTHRRGKPRSKTIWEWMPRVEILRCPRIRDCEIRVTSPVWRYGTH